MNEETFNRAMALLRRQQHHDVAEYCEELRRKDLSDADYLQQKVDQNKRDANDE